MNFIYLYIHKSKIKFFRAKIEIEKVMNNFNNIFNFHSIEKLRELLQEDSDKKFEERKNKNKQNGYNNNSNTEKKNKQNENKINN